MFQVPRRYVIALNAGLLVLVLALASAAALFGSSGAIAQGTGVCPANPSPPNAADPSIIVDSPAPGATITSPVTVAGKARTFEANVQIHVLDASGNAITDTFTTAAEGAPALAPFSESVAFSVPQAQDGCLMVFEGSAMDGSPRNVVLVPVVLSAEQAAPGRDLPEGLVAALNAYAVTQGGESAGPCDEADIDRDLGKWCWRVVSVSGDDAVVDFGPTFSEFAVRTSFVLALGEWQIEAEGVPPGTTEPAPPNTGTGVTSTNDTLASLPLVQVAALVMALAGGVAVATVGLRRR